MTDPFIDYQRALLTTRSFSEIFCEKVEGGRTDLVLSAVAPDSLGYGVVRADERKDVVVGGGIAGMEAARVATLRGHKTTLYEKTGELGGHVIEGSVDEFKKDNARLLEWYRTQMRELDVDVRLNEEILPEDVKSLKADAIFLATGSFPAKPGISGADRDNVITATEALLKRKPIGHRVIVLGGGLVGCETAISLAMSGKDVTIVEMLPELMIAGLSVPHMNRMMVLDMLRFYGVRVVLNSSISKINEDRVEILDKNFRKSIIPTDTVVVSIGLKLSAGYMMQ